MRRKLIINLGLLMVVVVFSSGLVVWHLNSMRANQAMVNFFHEHIDNFIDVFHLSTLVQQSQIELRYGLTDDINPLVDNVLMIDGYLEKASTALEDPKILARCKKCHEWEGNEKYKELAPKLRKLQNSLSTYKMQVSQFVTTTYGSEPKPQVEARAFRTSRDIVTLAEEIVDPFERMLNHLILQNRLWVNRTERLTITTFLIGFLAVFFLITRFVKQIVAPVLQLEQATRAISSGEYPERLPLETEDEIGDLARSFNQMVDVLKRVTGERERLLAETQNFNVALERRIEQVKRELKAAEDQLIRTEKLSAMGTLAAGVSHEISNPIHVIQGICSLILQDLEEGSQLTGDLQMIEREAARCQKIVNSLLDFARHHEPERRPTQVNRLVDESLDLIRAQKWSKKIELEKDLAELPEISVDGNRIKQVLINLLINAGQAMPNGGKLTVRTDLTPTGMDHLVRLRVCDTGAGIPKDIQPRIFDPFFTTKKGQEGTGLGLAISYRIVEEHGGTITVESEPGKGTCFTIVLPRSGGNGPAMKEGLV